MKKGKGWDPMNVQNFEFSTYHSGWARAKRWEFIMQIVNNDNGEIVCCAKNTEKDNWSVLTSTGIMFIIDKDQKKVVTFMLPRYSQALKVFKMAKKWMPVNYGDMIIRQKRMIEEMAGDEFSEVA